MSNEADIWKECCKNINGEYSGRSLKYSCTINLKYKDLDVIYNLISINRGLYSYFSKINININNKGNFKFLFARKTNPGFYLGPYGMPSVIRALKYNKIKSNTLIDKKYNIKTNNVELFNEFFSEDKFDILNHLPILCFEITSNTMYLLINNDLTDNNDFMSTYKQCCSLIDSLKEKGIIA